MPLSGRSRPHLRHSRPTAIAIAERNRERTPSAVLISSDSLRVSNTWITDALPRGTTFLGEMRAKSLTFAAFVCAAGCLVGTSGSTAKALGGPALNMALNLNVGQRHYAKPGVLTHGAIVRCWAGTRSLHVRVPVRPRMGTASVSAHGTLMGRTATLVVSVAASGWTQERCR